MTFNKLQKLINDNNIPHDVHLVSDSGWECDATEMNGVYYNEDKNVIVFTQGYVKYDDYFGKKGWTCLNSGESEYAREMQNPCDTCKNVGDCEPCERMREGENDDL